jgi:antitoxin (DNA-binding transcriptional repressor) of toxin-antitoxin stability system
LKQFPNQESRFFPERQRFESARLAQRETCYTFLLMKTISVRDLRQRWPQAEAALATEHVLIVTRDGKPVAKLIRFEEAAPKKKRFIPNEHRLRMKKIWGHTRVSLVQDLVINERERE